MCQSVIKQRDNANDLHYMPCDILLNIEDPRAGAIFHCEMKIWTEKNEPGDTLNERWRDV